MSCPKCGGVWTRQSGFRRCKKCGHVQGSQDVPKEYMGPTDDTPVDEWEDETLIRDKPGRQTSPLDFDQS
jgi:hypothetical protein